MARVLAAIAAFVLVLSPAALAQSPQTNAPPGNSAIDEYLETIPSASGSVRPRGPGGGAGALTPALRRRLDRLGPDGRTLARLVASTTSEAPRAVPARREVAAATSASRSPAGALIAAATGQDDGGGLGPVLPVILIASLVGAGTAVVVRARRRTT